MDATVKPPAKDAYSSHGVEAIDVAAVNAATQRSLFKARDKIHPKRVNGRFRQLKWIIMALTLAVYYGTPWLRWDRGIDAPSQAVLIDIPGRRFYFFFIELWPQEVIYITGLLVLAAVALFLMTAVGGRVWCGYMCPQTVWTDLFVVVERAVEGQRPERIKLDRAPLSFDKVRKRVTKHAIWLLIGLATGGAWVFYFADAPTLARQLLSFSASNEAYTFMGLATLMTYLLGGHAREQVCTYMCPWPRIQSALIDTETLAVTYRIDRGEPRGPHKKGDPWTGRGDCIDCRQCVAACPMGIDIRDGLQLECIQCALCIDACDDIMGKIERPTGLIGYDTDLNIARRKAGQATSFRPIRPRTVIYAAIMAVVGSIMLYGLITREDLDLTVLHDRNPTFTLLSGGDVRNGYTIRLLNKTRLGRSITIAIEAPQGAVVSGIGTIDNGDGRIRVAIDGDTLETVRVLVTMPRRQMTGDSLPITFIAEPVPEGNQIRVDSIFMGPK